MKDWAGFINKVILLFLFCHAANQLLIPLLNHSLTVYANILGINTSSNAHKIL